MKRQFRNILAIVFAASAFSCTRYEEFENDAYVPAPGETVKLILNATKGHSKASTETRVHVGEIASGKVKYHWTDEDQIGVIPFLSDAKPNYVTKETQINSSDPNLATFEAYITAEGYDTPDVDLLIYYPYNSSMLEGLTGSTGEDFTGQGLTFRLSQEQDQHGYSREFDSAKDPDLPRIQKHPSDWALSTYGLAYDLATSSFSSESEGGQTVASATGQFELDHVNTYFQFNVFGSKSTADPDKNYGDGTWKVASVTLQAGYCNGSTDESGKYVFSDPVTLAGTYKFFYEYDETDFDNVDKTENNAKIELQSVAGVDNVRVTMHDVQNSPSIGNDKDLYVPAFAVINPMFIKENPKGNLNCLKVSVVCYQVDENNNIVGSDTKTRYYDISSIVGKDIAGNYYTIDFEMCDPVEAYIDLSTVNTANCYLINAPGNYSFDASVAGNGRLPYGDKTMGIDPKNLLSDDKEYAIDWLWASGLSFDNVNDGKMSDADVVKKILNSVELSGDEGRMSIGLAAGLNTNALSGNILVALYEKNTDGTAGDIVWTWHLWLGQPEVQHYRFPATNSLFNYTNEDWFMMDRNLGAENNQLGDPRSAGLYYQSGRKEPIIGYNDKSNGSNISTNHIQTYRNTEVFGERAEWKGGVTYESYNTLKYPMYLISSIPNEESTSDYYYAWTSSQEAETFYDISNDTKSMFDPCPPGYRMPTVREWDNFKADKYLWITGGYASGVFGYSQWEGLANELSNNTDERAVDFAARIAAGDKYSVNDEYERTYNIVKFSGTGTPLTTTFPNTGIIRSDGTWGYLKEEGKYADITEIVHPKGPELTAEISANGAAYMIKAPVPTTATVVSDPWGANYLRIICAEADVYGTVFKLYETETENPQDTKGIAEPTTDNTDVYIANYSLPATFYIYKYDPYAELWSNATTINIDSNKNVTYTIGGDKESTKTTTPLTVTFKDAEGSYFYSSGSLLERVPITGSTVTISCESLRYNDLGSVYLYFCQTGSDGIATAPTAVRVTKESENSYKVTEITQWAQYSDVKGGEYQSGERATMALWTSGRIDTATEGENFFYSTYWFGPEECTTFGWASKNAYGEYHVLDGTGQAPAPYHERRETYGMGYNPTAINIYKPEYINGVSNGDYATTEWDNDPAVPTRCIREYDVSTAQSIAQ